MWITSVHIVHKWKTIEISTFVDYPVDNFCLNPHDIPDLSTRFSTFVDNYMRVILLSGVSHPRLAVQTIGCNAGLPALQNAKTTAMITTNTPP